MNDFPVPDFHRLRAAQGWLELGDHLEANEELERISPELRAHPDVLELRYQVYAKANKWDACVDIAAAIIAADPNRVAAWIQRSFALHELKQTQQAFDNLLPAVERFRDTWNIPYNLACYCAQLGRLEEAKAWFTKAILLDQKQTQRVGIDDPDLKPLWDSMSTTIWKRERADS